MSDTFAAALEAANIKIKKYDPSKKRPIFLSGGTTGIDAENLSKTFTSRLGKKIVDMDKPFQTALFDPILMDGLVAEYARSAGLHTDHREIAPEYEKLKLNIDLGSSEFFVTTEDDTISPICGDAYLLIMGLKREEAAANAEHAFREYNPRRPLGYQWTKDKKNRRKIFNTYTPPTWIDHPRFKTDQPKIPILFKKLIQHVFPLKRERAYFYAWLYMSLYKRAPTYLVLTGKGGLGKTRLKHLLKALHGYNNSPDGKKSGLTERFNSQVADTTLLWFDELEYNEKLENIMKEMQNDTLSIEKKGIDATRSTRIYASMVVTNNDERDNYIKFDARKFSPLELATTRLEDKSMTGDEIDQLKAMTNAEDLPTFDIGALAEFAKWLKKHGPGYADRYPNMEYRGPMFWRLAHTSMSKWQEAIVSFLLTPSKFKTARLATDKDGFFIWSAYEPTIKRTLKHYHWPHAETVRKFFDVFRDLDGRQVFETKRGTEIGSDFHFKFLVKKATTLDDEKEKTRQLL